MNKEEKAAPITLTEGFYGKEESRLLQESLINELSFERELVMIMGEEKSPNRGVDFRSEEGLSYAYSGKRKTGRAWTKTLKKIKDDVERETGERFNACLCNLYPNGDSGMGWHTDAEPDLEEDSVIASLSFGARRDFAVRRIKREEGEKALLIPLEEGSLLIMERGMQKDWEHSVPKRRRVLELRINLTFRKMRIPKKSGSFKPTF